MSHPSSYTGGTMYRDIGCTNANLNDAACITEAIRGNPVYDTPITEQCQANYIVLLTDGQANHNDSAQLIRDYVPKASCTSSNNDEECARDLVEWLRNNDQSSSLAGDQSVTTYTIGFNFSGQFLKDLANLGGGAFHEASTASELADVFQTIIADILAQTTSFTAPTLSVNAFNKLFHRNEVYFSFFKPERRIGWDGNVKKYQLCEDTADGCTLGEVLDADGTSAIGTDGSIIDSALSFWSNGTDGAEITVGGAGNEIPVNGSRTVLTYTGTTPPNGVNLGGLSHRVEDSNSDLTKALLGDAAMSDAERTDLINWIRGMDVDDVDANGDTTEDRYAFNDPLHSNPVVITYGGTESDPVLKVLVGTNDGGLRLINAFNGEEQWIIYPQSTLAKQRQVRPNPSGNHLYGLDGTPSVWVNDVDRDGTIEPSDGDFVRAFIGMRRGGDYIYAIEANPNANFDGQPGNTDDIDSTLLWRVKGDSTEFPRLGQTWSKPMLTSVRVGTTNAGESAYKDVLVFAGGYDETEDNGFGSGGLGNAIYFADPADGSRLLSISSHDPGSGQRLVVPDMTYPIPSDISLMDSDGDGATDRLYVGDTGGQLWRIDLAPDLSASAGLKPIIGKLAVLSDSVDPADRRKIFYQPDVMRASDNQYSSDARYDMVMVVTGNRANPLSTEVVDRAYAIRDFNVDGLSDSNDDGLADGLTTIQGPLVSSTGDLFNATNDINPTGSDLSDLRSAKGWYVDLEESGEKALARPVVIAGKMFFTTYLPDAVVAATNCSLAEGGGRLYGLNVLNAAPVLNWDGLGDDTNLVKNDRHQQLGSGIPSGVVTVYQEEGVTGLVGSGAGAKPFDPGAEFPRFRTYWYEEG